MNKKTKILIGILAVGIILIACWWIWNILVTQNPPHFFEMGCNEKCKSLGHASGYCGVEMGRGVCLEDETNIGATKDCRVKEGKALIAPVACCCVKEARSQVTITTDKTEYKQGEGVKITIRNNLEKYIELNYKIEKITEEAISLVHIHTQECPLKEPLELPVVLPGTSFLAHQTMDFMWNQKDICTGIQQPIGVYRAKADVIIKEYENHTVIGEERISIFSNEFTIKEKSAIDPRCSEKVKGFGDCDGCHWGYEFDAETGKCVKKVVCGCSFEIPFKSLEECQRVCEKGESADVPFPPIETELTYCDNDSDCVLVNSGCCDCSMGGGMVCINKKYLEYWNQKLKLDCKDIMDCPAVYLCDDNPTGCKCVNNVCKGVRE